MAAESHPRPVFLDATGKRWRRLRLATLALGVVTSLLAVAVIASILVPPLVPDLRVQRAFRSSPHLVTSRVQRKLMAKRLQLWFALRSHRAPPSLPASRLPAPARGKHGRRLGRRDRRARVAAPKPRRPIVAGFYVNWDDNSWVSLQQNDTALDWVVCEWGFVDSGGDSLRLRVDRRVPFAIAQLPAARRPSVLLMVSNFDSATGRWNVRALAHLLRRRRARARVVAQLADAVSRYRLGGVTLDFEEVPAALAPSVARFAHELHARFAPDGRVVTQTVSTADDRSALARYAAVDDELFLMLYDEHYATSSPGPVAGQAWYLQQANSLLRVIPRRKAILALGAYGYDWNDGDSASNGQARTFQEIMAAVRDAPRGALHFDRASLNPYATWTDPDSTDHVAWYLDAVTAYDEMLAGEALGTAGVAIWRLGDEDPAIWHALGRGGLRAPPASLDSIPAGYDPEIVGRGEILRVRTGPHAGARTVTVDPRSHYIIGERVTAFPTPWVVDRWGASAHRVALTFDDGPDGQWTPEILDTLASRHAPATFFVVGQNVEAHLPLVRRMLADGHEFGNHTFTHPNLALTGPFVTRLEIDANERLLEAVLDRRTSLFRPPYFGDAEPTTVDELGPVGIATQRGYLTVGLHIDSEDWQRPGVRTIIDTVLAQLPRGNVILLHDGGGNRSETVAALGSLIDSLRARGDTLVPVSGLIGLTRDAAMPGLPPRSAVARLSELAAFGLIGVLEWVLYWIFLAAVVLGVGRLLVIAALAVVQRVRRHQDPGAPVTYAPSVSVIVPAFMEERVIGRTLASLLTQRYPGALEVLVVDDGSTDGTFAAATREAAGHDHVRVLRKPNGGKASALNFGLALAAGEIVICLDADTLFAPSTVTELVEPLHDPRVGAVAGNAKVGNRVNLVTRWQAIEYVTSQNLDRRAFAQLNCITVVPGAVGAWRRSLVVEAGGFSADTLAEDQDLTLGIRRRGYAIAYADEAVGYTEAPETLRGLSRQRFRWSFGTLQCVWKHRDVLFRRRYGSLGWVALPNVLLFQLFYPAISPVADLLFLWSLVSVWLIRRDHGATYALTSLEQVLTFYAVFLVVDWFATMVAFALEPGENRSLTWLVFLQRFAYRQVMYWVVVRSFLAAVRGRLVGWNKLERTATVDISDPRIVRAR